MLVNQYVYFALFSRDTSAAEITAILGLEPDETRVRGSRMPEPDAIPVFHCWKVVCREPGLRVDEQVARILERLAPHTEAIAALARRLDAEDRQGSGAALEIVRHFNDEAGRKDHPLRRDAQAGAPDLLGWHLSREVLEFLHATGAVLDVDEYDLTPDYADD